DLDARADVEVEVELALRGVVDEQLVVHELRGVAGQRRDVLVTEAALERDGVRAAVRAGDGDVAGADPLQRLEGGLDARRLRRARGARARAVVGEARGGGREVRALGAGVRAAVDPVARRRADGRPVEGDLPVRGDRGV